MEKQHKQSYEVPDETVISFSPWKQVVNIFLAVLVVVVGGFWLLFPKQEPFSFRSILSYAVGVFFIFAGSGFLRSAIHDFSNRDPQLLIGDKGIKRLGGSYYSWEEIHNEKIVKKGAGRYSSYHLMYSCPKGLVDMTISGLNVDRAKLKELLNLYRSRSNAGG